jgi:hypothetical protein
LKTSFIQTIARLQPFLDRMQFFAFNEPMNAAVLDRLNKTAQASCCPTRAIPKFSKSSLPPLKRGV